MSALSYWQKKLAQREKHLTEARARLKQREAAVKRQEGWVAKREAAVKDAKHHIAVLQRPEHAVAWALKQVGTTESPAGSNKGPGISDWEKHWLGYDGYAWCGAFAGYALALHGGVKGLVGKRIVYTPDILTDAKYGQNGFEKLVKLSDAQKGDLILMDFEAGGAPVMHVGIAREDYNGGSVINTVEGNTSSGDAGSQSNGGGVFKRTRPASVIVGVARPRWA